jgi:hypothetical protein
MDTRVFLSVKNCVFSARWEDDRLNQSRGEVEVWAEMNWNQAHCNQKLRS